MTGSLNRRTLLKGAASLAGVQALASASALSQPLDELGETAERSIALPDCLQTSGPHMSWPERGRSVSTRKVGQRRALV